MNNELKFHLAYEMAMTDFFKHCIEKGMNADQIKDVLSTEKGESMVADRIKFYLESI